MSDGTSILHFSDPETFEEIGRIEAREKGGTKAFTRPEDRVTGVQVLNGIAYDSKNGRLFVTGKFWPRLFEVGLISPK